MIKTAYFVLLKSAGLSLPMRLKERDGNRKLKITGLILSILYCLLSPFAVFAAFEDIGTGARGTALGSNYVSMGDDVMSLAYNPASLARVQQKEITSEYSRLYAG